MLLVSEILFGDSCNNDIEIDNLRGDEWGSYAKHKRNNLSPIKSKRFGKTMNICIAWQSSDLGRMLLEGSLYEGSSITSESNHEITFNPEEEEVETKEERKLWKIWKF